MGEIELVKIKNPFQRQNKDVVILKSGSNLADICKDFIKTINKRYGIEIDPQHADEHIAVSINGLIIPSSFWSSTFPKDGDQVVVMPVVGKGDTEKMILNIVIMIVIIMIVGPAVAGAFGTAGAGGGLAGASLGYTVAYVATVAIGGMMVNSLSPKAKAKSSPGFDGSELSQTFGWDPASLQRQGIPVPRFYGRNKLYGNVIAAWTELTAETSNEQYLYTVISLCMGPIRGIITEPETSIKVNNQSVDNFDDITVYTNNGLVRQPVLDSGFDQTKTELVANRKVTATGGAIVYETPDADFDDMEIDLAFPAGLFDVSGGSVAPYSVNVIVEIKKKTDINFIRITQSTETITDAETSKVIRTYDSIRRTVTGITQANPGVVTHPSHPYNNGDEIGFTDVSGMTEVNGNSYTIANATGTTYEIDDTSGFTPYTSGGIAHKDLSQVIEYGNKYNIRVTKVTADKNDPEFADNLYLDRVREVTDAAFTYPRTALGGMKALATDQLSGTIRFSAIANCLYVRVYDSTTQTWSIEYSTNPAWIIFDLLTQPVYSGAGTGGDPFVVNRYDGRNPSELDLPKFSELAAFCGQKVTNPETHVVAAVTEAAQALVTTTDKHLFIVGDDVEFRNVTGLADGEATVLSVPSETTFTVDRDTSSSVIPDRADQLHIQYEGDDGDTTAIDISPNSHLFRRNGTVGFEIDTSIKKFGQSSGLWNDPNSGGTVGTASDYASWDITASAVDDWTVDFWVRIDVLDTRHPVLVVYEDSDNSWRLQINVNTGTVQFLMEEATTFKIDVKSTGTLAVDTWYHIALIKSADEWGIYIDGSQDGYDQNSDVASFQEPLDCPSGNFIGHLYGHIDELRINHSNIFNASPNVGETDTITVPTTAYNANGTVEKVKHFIDYNGGFDEETTVWDAALRICEIARCALIPLGSKISLAIDKATDIIVQTFTVGDIIKDSFSIEYLPQSDRASEIELHYRDAGQDYKRVPFTIFNPDVESTNSKVVLDYFGITDTTQAENAGNLRLLRNKLLKRLIKFRSDVNAIHAQIGDRIRVQHDMVDWGMMTDSDKPYGGGGQVVSATNETNATVTINRPLQFIPAIGSDIVYEMLIAHGVDDSIEVKTVTGYDEATDTVTVSGTFTVPPANGDVWAVGRENLVTKDYTVLFYERSQTQKITLHAIEYNADIYVGDPA